MCIFKLFKNVFFERHLTTPILCLPHFENHWSRVSLQVDMPTKFPRGIIQEAAPFDPREDCFSSILPLDVWAAHSIA